MKVFYSNFYKNLNLFLKNYDKNNIFILIDKNVDSLWYNTVIQRVKILKDSKKFIIEATEKAKSIENEILVWQFLSENKADRKSLIINIGGGITTDLGGFVAATFKRGCDFVNIPTTLLAMVDAAVGNKTGINFNGLKNEIGVFYFPKAVFIDVNFLRTLPQADFYDGYAEMLKYGFIYDKNLLNETYKLDLENIDFEKLTEIVKKNIKIKNYFIKTDKKDEKERHALNFGHTFAHGFEAFSTQNVRKITHGTAVAWGMAGELFLSHRKLGFDKNEFLKLHSFVKENYSKPDITCKNYEEIYKLLQHDKKNTSLEINFTLLSEIGKFHINQKASQSDIYKAMEYMF